MTFSDTLTAQHRACDAAFVKIEKAAHAGDWSAAAAAVGSFLGDMEAHLAFEEEVLFPALEQATPMASGPTSVMHGEHAQMRELFVELREAAAARDPELLSDAGETLLMLMQQHNAKEENVLYPIADRVLSPDLLTVWSTKTREV